MKCERCGEEIYVPPDHILAQMKISSINQIFENHKARCSLAEIKNELAEIKKLFVEKRGKGSLTNEVAKMDSSPLRIVKRLFLAGLSQVWPQVRRA